MNIKVYDKLVELIGRDVCKSVSKVKEILGSKRIIGKFKQRFREANQSGVSALEISFIFTDEP